MLPVLPGSSFGLFLRLSRNTKQANCKTSARQLGLDFQRQPSSISESGLLSVGPGSAVQAVPGCQATSGLTSEAAVHIFKASGLICKAHGLIFFKVVLHALDSS